MWMSHILIIMFAIGASVKNTLLYRYIYIYIYIYIFNDKQIEFECESVAQGTKLLDS